MLVLEQVAKYALIAVGVGGSKGSFPQCISMSSVQTDLQFSFLIILLSGFLCHKLDTKNLISSRKHLIKQVWSAFYSSICSNNLGFDSVAVSMLNFHIIYWGNHLHIGIYITLYTPYIRGFIYDSLVLINLN